MLWPGVPAGLRTPVVAYVLCLAAMAAPAAVRWQVLRGRADAALAQRAALGGVLFLCSDALLVFNRFHTPLPASALRPLDDSSPKSSLSMFNMSGNRTLDGRSGVPDATNAG